MAKGNYEIADSKIAQAEALQPKYPFLHIGDTPKKARADLDRALAERSAGNHKQQRPAGKAPTDPFLAAQPAGNSASSGASTGRSDAAKPMAKTSDAATTAQTATSMEVGGPNSASGQKPIGGLRMPGPSGGLTVATSAAGSNPAGGPADLTADSGERNPWDVDPMAKLPKPARAEAPATRAVALPDDKAAANQNMARSQSDALLLESRRLFAHGDLHNAQIKLQQAQGLGVSYGALDDSPAKIESLIQKAGKLPTNVEANDAESVRRQRAEVLTEQAEGLLRWHEFNEAQRLAGEVQRLDVRYGPLEQKPEQLLERIAAAQRAASGIATAGLVAGTALMNQAQQLADPSILPINPAAMPLNPAAMPLVSGNAPNKQCALGMTKLARAAMAQGDWVSAEQIAREAESLAPDTAFSATEDRPTLVLLDIQRVKRGGSVAGNAAGAPAGGVIQASAIEPIQSENSNPHSQGRYGEMQALYDPASDATRNMPANASGLPDRSQLGKAMPLSVTPPTTNLTPPPAGNMGPSPENGTGEGLRWYRAGLDAVANSRMDEALKAFRQSYAFQTELDPATRQQLYEHLKVLGETTEPLQISDGGLTEMTQATGTVPAQQTPGSARPASGSPSANGTGPTGSTHVLNAPLVMAAPNGSRETLPVAATGPVIANPPMPLDATTLPNPTVSSATLSRQVAAEVTRQQTLARDMREKQPKQALQLLQRTREMVASASGIDPTAREQLLRRLDLSISDLQKFIAANAPEIEQEEKNRQVTQDVDRTRKEKVEVDEKVAALVKDFNRMLDEQRYAEAQVLAKRATELDPENPVVVQLNVMAKMVSRVAQNQQIQDQQEDGFWRHDGRSRQVGHSIFGRIPDARHEEMERN